MSHIPDFAKEANALAVKLGARCISYDGFSFDTMKILNWWADTTLGLGLSLLYGALSFVAGSIVTAHILAHACDRQPSYLHITAGHDNVSIGPPPQSHCFVPGEDSGNMQPCVKVDQ